MNEWFFALAFMAGLLLGGLYFVGLWWTVRRGLVAKHPALWFSTSMLLRTSIVLLGFYFVGRDHWERLVVCLLGFVLARLIVTLRLRSGQARLTRVPAETRTHPEQEGCYAPESR